MTAARARLGLYLAVVGALAIGLLYHFPIVENDLFWMLRAGEEIVRGQGIQTTEHWSSTVRGSPWLNYQWLSTVLFYLWSRLTPDDRFLPSLRALLAAALALEAWVLAGGLRAPRGPVGSLALAPLAAVPLFALACQANIQLRPDLFGLLLFAGVLIVLEGRLRDSRKAVASIALLALWANLHAGTAPLGVAVVWSWLAFASPALSPMARVALAAASGAAAFASPTGGEFLAIIWRNTGGYDRRLTMNPDQASFAWEYLVPGRHGYQYWTWLTLTALAFLASGPAFFWRAPSGSIRGSRLAAGAPASSPYSHRAFTLVFGVFVTALALARLRAIGYCVLFFLPVTGATLAAIEATLARRLGAHRGRTMAVALTLAAWLPIAVDLARTRPPLPAFGLYGNLYPVGAAEFLARARPPGKLFNVYDHGGFLIDRLRDYPVALDSRELIYRDFLVELDEVFTHPTRDKFAAFWRRHGFEILLLPARGSTELYALMAPGDEWRLAYADAAALVFTRKAGARSGRL